MNTRVRIVGIVFATTFALSPPGFSQAQTTQNRIPQQIVVNGQNATGVYVTTPGGQIQSFTCPSPQQYTTADGSSRGWTCYEQATGVWLLSAAPAQAPAPQVAPAPIPVPADPAPTQFVAAPPPVVIYQQPVPVMVYQPVPTMVYQAPAPVIYPQPTVIYSQPVLPPVVYASAPRPVIVAPAYPSSVVLGSAAIQAAGRITSAAILASNQPRYVFIDNDRDRPRGRGRR
jgi:hypothetical protein